MNINFYIYHKVKVLILTKRLALVFKQKNIDLKSELKASININIYHYEKRNSYFMIFANSVIYSQNLGLDTSFDSDGKVFNTSISEFPQEIFFEDNKYFFVFDNGFCSINYDGTTNTSFGVNGKIFFNNSTEFFLTKGAKMHNGYIYIFGQQSYNSSSTNKNSFIAKISTSGVFDTSFGIN